MAISNASEINFGNKELNEFIVPMIQQRIDAEFDKYVEILKSRKKEITAGIIMGLADEMSAKNFGRDLTITFKREE